MHKIRVLYLIPAKSASGPNIALLNMMIGLAGRNNVESHLVTSKSFKINYSPWFERLRKMGVRFHMAHEYRLNVVYWLSLLFKTLQALLSKEIELIHVAILRPFLFLGFIAKIFSKKILLSLEGNPDYEIIPLNLTKKIVIMTAWSACMWFADLIVPCSYWLKKEVGKRHPTLTKKLVVMHNPIDFERFNSASSMGVRRELDTRSDDFIILTAGRLDPVKDIETFLKAAKNVLKEIRNAWFMVVGDGPQRDELEKLAKRLEVNDRVIFTGFRKDIERFMVASDIFVMTSIYEPFGLVVAEAMAARKPVVITNIGGMPEIVTKDTGIIVKAKEPSELAEAVIKLLQDPKLRRNMGRSAAERARILFSSEAIALKLTRIYRSLIN